MKRFFANLSHSARITLTACGCFILLTMLILIFLMLCPIRQSSSANNVNNSLVITGTTVASTTASQTETTVSSTSRTRLTTDPNRTSTSTVTTEAYEEDSEYSYEEPDYSYDEPENSYQAPVVTKKHNSNNNGNSNSSVSKPTYTLPPSDPEPTVTNAPAVVTDPPYDNSNASRETLPAPED